MKKLLLILLATPCFSYTTITLSPGTPESIETSLIAQTTVQYTSSLVVNPFFPNTYQLTISGLSPTYNPFASCPACNVTCPSPSISIDTTTLSTMGIYVDSEDWTNNYLLGYTDGQIDALNTIQTNLQGFIVMQDSIQFNVGSNHYECPDPSTTTCPSFYQIATSSASAQMQQLLLQWLQNEWFVLDSSGNMILH